MAPHPGIDTEQIRDKARKDILDLLEGVCKAKLPLVGKHIAAHVCLGSREEEPGD